MKKSLICMLLVLLLAMTGCSSSNEPTQESSADQPAGTVSIVDMAGRTVEVPENIDKVLSRCPIGTVIMYTLNPEKIAGQNWKPTDSEKEYLEQNYLNLPMLSGWYADGKVGNVEEIVKAGPDIIFSSFESKASQAVIDQADGIQSQLNIPVVMIDSSLENMPEMYEFVGKLVGEEARAKELSDYIVALMDDVKTKSASISEDQKVKVYYAEGTEGLQTDPSGSEHSRIIDLVGAVNVAKVEIKIGMGRSTVSPEQLLEWAPDVIIACHDQGFAAESATYSQILQDQRFATLKAMKEGKVYEIPYKPFNFFDRPPSVNRLIGIKWLGNLLYPDVYNYDTEKDLKEIYKLFYRIDLDQTQVDDILKNSK